MRRHLFPGLAAAAMAALPFSQASAQGQTYCDGRVQASNFYSTTETTPQHRRVSYFVSVQNMVEQSLVIEVTFRDPRNLVIPGGGGPQTRRLGAYGTSQPIQLGVVVLPASSGAGGLSVPVDLVAGTTITCRAAVRPGG